MSRPVPSAQALRALVHLSSGPYICTSCLTTPNGTSRRTASKPRAPQQHWRRAASTVAPVTSVNATRTVPEQNRDLHNALSSVAAQAANYVNLSQLQLALRGLEGKDPVTRIALRQIGDSGLSKRLARLLLADPLAQAQEWETKIGEDDRDGRSLLIRYSENVDYNTSNPLVRVLGVPAPTLSSHRLELLLLSPSITIASVEDKSLVPEEALVAVVETPISNTGRYSQVTYPVHKAVTIGSGLKGVRHIPSLSKEAPDSPLRQLLTSAVDVTWSNPEQSLADEGLSIISLDQGERALAEFRQSPSNSIEYEHDWLNSKVANVNNFVLQGTSASTGLKPVHRTYISNIISSASDAITADEAAAATQTTTEPARSSGLASLNNSITSWAEAAHTELRDELANAFASRSWRKLAWWKLPWRVDDVGMIGSDILARFYLVDAEKGIIWVSGQLEQAGLTNFSTSTANKRSPPGSVTADDGETSIDGAKRGWLDAIPGARVRDHLPNRETPLVYFKVNAPWPQQIAISRAQLATVALPALQARAESLMLQALSGSSLASAVGALAYTMDVTTTLYEAGAVAAFGIVVSMGRLQRLWERTRIGFVKEVQEEGRIVLDEVERECREVVRMGVELKVDDGAADREAARQAVEEANETLEKTR